MKINRYLPFAFIYFFINSLALPFGLTYTAILSPLLYWWVITQRKKEILLPFLICLSPFFIIHFILGVDTASYIVSIVNYIMVYIFCQTFYIFLITAENKEKVFRKLLIANFIFCVVAIPLLFTSYSDLLWMQANISNGIDNFSRLKLFTYEASYYAILFTPLFFFIFYKSFLSRIK